MAVISQGAEALVHERDGLIIKERIPKPYRHPLLDARLRASRTRREAKILAKLEDAGFPAPRLQHVDDKSMSIKMTRISGQKLKDVFSSEPERFGREVGAKIAALHNHNIMHADLTTSNMILNDEIYFLDFGLSFFSTKVEDRACDLHVLSRALESAHHESYPACWNAVLEGYSGVSAGHHEVFRRLAAVQQRGRNK